MFQTATNRVKYTNASGTSIFDDTLNGTYMAIKQPALYRIAMDCYGGGGYNCIYICTGDPTVNANYSILAWANSSNATTCEAVVQITINPTYIMCGSSNNASGFNMTDPFFTIE